MSFVDLRFLLFFPVVALLNVLLPHRYRWMMLLVASYTFYMAWKPEYGLLLFLITSIDFFAGRFMSKTDNDARRRMYLIMSLVGNLGLLFYFKYFNFVFESFSYVLGAFGSSASIPVLHVLLPIGISFHVFQSLSYTIDVYRRRVEPVSHFGKFALYVSFFPQLVAGPIERPQRLLKQFFENRQFDLHKAQEGVLLVIWGYFKKLVIADNIAPLVNAVYDDPTGFPGPSLAIATVLFAYQIYCDFSGYSDIARGTAKILGYDLMKNFDRPYASKSIGEFWRRWHISLSTWFRDYVYMPLGGSLGTAQKTSKNLMVTFLLSGLWHGANWTFVLWGGINGIYLVIQRLYTHAGLWTPVKIDVRPHWLIQRIMQHVMVLALICLTWIFFRAQTIGEAFYILTHIPTGIFTFIEALGSDTGRLHVLAMDIGFKGLVIGIVAIVVLEIVDYLHAHYNIGVKLAHMPALPRTVLYATTVCAILLLGAFGTPQQFIYFQF
jgi:alginate O-acetyltransferase complex protein AlgI